MTEKKVITAFICIKDRPSPSKCLISIKSTSTSILMKTNSHPARPNGDHDSNLRERFSLEDNWRGNSSKDAKSNVKL